MRYGSNNEVFLRVYTLSSQVKIWFCQFWIAAGHFSGLSSSAGCRVNPWHPRADSAGNAITLAFWSSLLFQNADILEKLRKPLPGYQKGRPKKECWRVGEDKTFFTWPFFSCGNGSVGPCKVIKSGRTFIGINFAADTLLSLESAGNHCHALI